MEISGFPIIIKPCPSLFSDRKVSSLTGGYSLTKRASQQKNANSLTSHSPESIPRDLSVPVSYSPHPPPGKSEEEDSVIIEEVSV